MAYDIYKVVAGDNLTKIANKYGSTVAELAKINNIANPNLIFVGQELKVPVPDAAPAAAETAGAPATKKYTIQPGDNLTKIAKQFGTTVDTLVRYNRIANPNLIYAGSELVIPVDEAHDAAVKAAEEAQAKAVAEAKEKAEAQEKAIAQAKAIAAAKANAAAAAEERAKAAEAEKAAAAAAADFANKQAAGTLNAAQAAVTKEAAKAETKVEEKKGFLSGLFGKKN